MIIHTNDSHIYAATVVIETKEGHAPDGPLGLRCHCPDDILWLPMSNIWSIDINGEKFVRARVPTDEGNEKSKHGGAA